MSNNDRLCDILEGEFSNWVHGPNSPVPVIMENLKATGHVMPNIPEPTGKSTQGQLMWKIDDQFAVVVRSFNQQIGVRIGPEGSYREISVSQAQLLLEALAAAIAAGDPE